MQATNIPVVNSNIHNFLSPDTPSSSHLHRINPDKHTFLNSNLLVSNILNHLPDTPPSTNATVQEDAYTNKDDETIKHHERKFQEKEKIERVKKLAKCRSQTTLDEMMRQQKVVSKQVDEIHLMRKQMTDKAKDILSRKDNNTYLGRNILNEGEKYLKGMKEGNPDRQIRKVEATRTLMKEAGKKAGRKERLNQRREEADSQLNDTQVSSLDISMSASMLKREAEEREIEKLRDDNLARLIRNKSYDQVFKEERRLASWQGFSECWKRAFMKNDDIVVTKPGKKLKKETRTKYIEPTQQSVLEYHDKFSRHAALKNYGRTFAETACSFNIEVK